jgi:hypothetical protein
MGCPLGPYAPDRGVNTGPPLTLRHNRPLNARQVTRLPQRSRIASATRRLGTYAVALARTVRVTAAGGKWG